MTGAEGLARSVRPDLPDAAADVSRAISCGAQIEPRKRRVCAAEAGGLDFVSVAYFAAKSRKYIGITSTKRKPPIDGENNMAPGQDDHARFARLVLPHLGDAYSLARWITGNRADAEDVVQDA
jgi:Sigma-70 region 2